MVDAAADWVARLITGVLEWLYGWLGVRYLLLVAVAEAVSGVAIWTGAVGWLSRYRPMSFVDFVLVAGAGSVFTLVMLSVVLRRAWPMVRPVVTWVDLRDKAGIEDAWRGMVDLPLALVTRAGAGSLLAGLVPSVVVAMLVLGLPVGDLPIVLAVAGIALAYGLVLNVFALELALRPVVRDIARELPPSFVTGRRNLSLRWKLLLALPLINLISGVAVAALVPGAHRSLGDLGVTVLLAGGIALSIAFLLTAVVGGAILGAVGELATATRRVREGDLSWRVSVSSTDEFGQLGDMFNEMVAGLSERAVLRDALSSYVHPQLAERVVREGLTLAGEEFDVTVVFVDMVGFTSFADRVDAASAVARVNAFLAEVVPVISRHGGYVDKFIGDGLLAVFGAPERVSDHAERGLAAACEIACLSDPDRGGWRAGVGVNSGRVLAGTIGAGDRYEFTVIGDAVNVASRVERATRELGEPVLVTGETRERLADPKQRGLVALGNLCVRGKRDPVAVYAPLAGAVGAPH